MLSIVYAVLFYAATAMLVVGVALKIRSYAGTPAPLKIPTTPAPTTTTGVALRLTREVVFFESLFKANKWTWVFGWMFHAALLLVVLRHVRYFQQPVWGVIAFVQPFGTYAGFAMVAGWRACGRGVFWWTACATSAHRLTTCTWRCCWP